MENLVHDWIGWVHLITSCLALVFGAMVIAGKKGTVFHKRMGFLFAVNMLLLLLTAMMIYRLFNGFGFFHIFAVIGFIYLFLGLYPAFTRRKNWLKLHIYFMYWTVIGLYCAFAAEIMVRIPNTPFWGGVALGTGLVAFLGGVFYGKYIKSWKAILAAHE